MSEARAKRLDPRAERSRAALRGALVELLGAMPIEQISILALTARAGIGYATFFRNYADIEAVLSDLSGVLIDELADMVTTVAANGNAAASRAIARFAVERRAVLEPLFVGASATLQRDIITRAMAKGSGGQRVSGTALPGALATAHSVTVICTIYGWWLGPEGGCSEPELATIIDRLAFAPLS